MSASGDELAAAGDDDLAAYDDAARAADDAAALAAVQAVDSHATMATDELLDPDDVAARLTAGESDHHVDLGSEAPLDAAASAASAADVAEAADDALRAHDADSDAPDASASDDPAVD